MACNYFCDGVDKAPQRSLFNALGMTKEEILAVFYPETDVAKMRETRRTYRALKTNS